VMVQPMVRPGSLGRSRSRATTSYATSSLSGRGNGSYIHDSALIGASGALPLVGPAETFPGNPAGGSYDDHIAPSASG
jgi:hypothetical protein